MNPTTTPPARRHVAAFDGLRGIAVIFVVLQHGWTLWPKEYLYRIRPFDSLFFDGNLAVTIFFVLGSFVVTKSLLTEWDQHRTLNPLRFYVRRYVRLSAQLFALLGAIAFVNLVDNTDLMSPEHTRASLLAIAGYYWNWHLMGDPLESRVDLGHLWYLSVEQQSYVVLALAIALLGARRGRLLAGLCVLIVFTAVWRWHVIDTVGWDTASLRTSTRMDGILWGSAAALVVNRVPLIAANATRYMTAGAVAMFAVLMTSVPLGDDNYFRVQGTLMDLATAVFVLAAHHAYAQRSVVSRFFGWRPLVWLGTLSYGIYLWHYVVFWAVARHTNTWWWPQRTVVAMTLLTIIVLAADRWIEQPTKQWLDRRRRTASGAATATDAAAATGTPAPGASAIAAPQPAYALER